jgi:hypothetical protein
MANTEMTHEEILALDKQLEADPTYWDNVLMGTQRKQAYPTAILPGKAAIMYDGDEDVHMLILFDPTLSDRTFWIDFEGNPRQLFADHDVPEIGWM